MSDLQKFDELKAQISVFVAPIKDVVVSNDESSAKASKAFRDLTDWEKKIEAKRKELVGPLNDQVKRINEYAKEVTSQLSTPKKHLGDELVKFERVLEAQRQEALRVEREERLKREEEARKQIELQRADAEAKAKALKEEAEAISLFAPIDEAEEAKDKADAEATKIKAQADAEAARIAFEEKKEHWEAKKEIASNKVAGMRRTWTYEVLSASEVPNEFKVTMLDDKKIKKAIANGERSILGIRIFQHLDMTAR